MKKTTLLTSQQAAFLIRKPPIFSFEECLWFLDRNYDDCLHRIEGRQLSKALHAPDGPLLFRLQEEPDSILVRLLAGKPSPANLEYLRKFLNGYIDLDSPLPLFYALLQQDSRLAYMARAFHGLRLVGIPDLFEGLVWCIIGQQINLSFAYRLKRRLVEAYGSRLSYEGQDYPVFPTPEALAAASPEDLRSMQFSGNKARYMIGIAQLFAERKMSEHILREAPDLPARLRLLTDIKGVGAWTANYVLMKCLHEKDCIPYGDTGLMASLRQHHIGQGKPSRQEIDAFFRPFAGWQSYLVFYLWRSLSVPAYGKPG